MLRVDRVETFLVDLPTIRPHVLSMATMYRQTHVMVRVHCSDGTSGIGEASTIGGLSYSDESPEGMELAIRTYMTPLLLRADPSSVARTMTAISQQVVGNPFAKAAVEMALLDAQGKRMGMPVSELLGGRQRDVLPVAWTLASGDTAKDIDEAERMLDVRRHRIFKLKIGKRAMTEDVAHVTAIKQVLGDRASIRVDVNQAWDETTAACAMERLKDAGVDLVEQPIAAWNIRGMARLTQQSSIPVMADESLRGVRDAFALAASASADVFAVKVAQSGGLYGACRVAAIAEAAGIGLYGGTMLEGSIGTAGSAHVFATFGALSWGTELFGPLLLTEELLTEPLTYSNFALQVPCGPGLGVAIDEDRLHFLDVTAALVRV